MKDNFHAKNWRPQLLTIIDVDENGNPLKPHLLALAGQLKKGKGLNMFAALIKGDVLDSEVCERAKDVRQVLKLHMQNEAIQGFLEVSERASERAKRASRNKKSTTNPFAPFSLGQVIPSGQGSNSCENVWGAAIHSGLGPLSPNAVLIGWPGRWADDEHKDDRAEAFVKTLKGLTNLNKAILVLKGGEELPHSIERMLNETIDIWWIVHDGERAKRPPLHNPSRLLILPTRFFCKQADCCS